MFNLDHLISLHSCSNLGCDLKIALLLCTWQHFYDVLQASDSERRISLTLM